VVCVCVFVGFGKVVQVALNWNNVCLVWKLLGF
jgi:hypothetical protein